MGMAEVGGWARSRNCQLFVRAAVTDGANKDIAACCSCEYRQPADDCRGDEVAAMRLAGSIAAPHFRVLNETEFRRLVRSQTEFGNESKTEFHSALRYQTE